MSSSGSACIWAKSSAACWFNYRLRCVMNRLWRRVFFSALRERFAGAVVLEPRHATWREAQALLVDWRVARVVADPAVIDAGAGWQGLGYWRLHGSPRIYHSAYGPQRVQAFARQLNQAVASGIPTWCIFDNTASGHAVTDGLWLLDFHAQHFQA